MRNDDDPDGFPDASESDDADEAPPTPGAELVEYMLGLYMSRTLTAKQFCVSMHFSANAGCDEAKSGGGRHSTASARCVLNVN